MVLRDIAGLERIARVAEYWSTISRYDLLLGLIPTAFVVAFLVGHVFGLPFEATVLGAAAIASIALFDGLFVRPPTGLQGT